MSFLVLRRTLTFVAAGLGAIAVSCASTSSGPDGTGPTGPTITGTAGNDGGTTSPLGGGGDDAGTVSLGGGDDAASSGDSCQHFDVQFVPKIPLVFVLVDDSGSMYDSMAWDPLRTGVLSVIDTLQAQVSFGFAAFTGQNASNGNVCPYMIPMTPMPMALNNYNAINTIYSGIMKPTFKAETPTAKAMALAAQSLDLAEAAQASGGGKYILFVTDGEPDFCDDGNPVCPVDSVVAELQKLYTDNINTIVFGIQSVDSDISAGSLQAFANAGAGLPVLPPVPNGGTTPITPQGIYQQCNGVAGWNEFFTAANLPMNDALGTYATTATVPSATLYNPNAADQTALTNAIASALSTVKSCSFDLQGKIKINLASASRGGVTIDGAAIPYDSANGWTMSTATELDLVGTACQTWRTTGMNIAFNFPCDVVIQ